jgi:hypothetical protein
MDLTDLTMTLTVVVVLTAVAVLILYDYLKKRRQHQQIQRIKFTKTAPPLRPTRIFDASPLSYAPAKKPAAERPLEPQIAIATPSRPPVQSRVEREIRSIEMAAPSPSTLASPKEIQPPVAAPPVFTLPPFMIDEVLWERLISSQPRQNLLSSSDTKPAPMHTPSAKPGAPPKLAAPEASTLRTISADAPHAASSKQLGQVIQKPELDEMLEREEPFTGLVISIGINEIDSSMWHSQGLMNSVGSHIAGLLRENDFSCRTAYDEFVMVCPGEQGAQSQRRLNYISECLWDYQLRGIGACSILFSWGGVQVQDRPLAEAIDSATERMRETKRCGHSAKSTVAHRQAV